MYFPIIEMTKPTLEKKLEIPSKRFVGAPKFPSLNIYTVNMLREGKIFGCIEFLVMAYSFSLVKSLAIYQLTFGD